LFNDDNNSENNSNNQALSSLLFPQIEMHAICSANNSWRIHLKIQEMQKDQLID